MNHDPRALLQRAGDESMPTAGVPDASLARLPVELVPGAFASELRPGPAAPRGPAPR